MAVQVITDLANPSNPMEDYVFRTQMEHQLVQDRGTTYKTVKVKVEAGPVDAKGKRQIIDVALRYALDQQFIFACFSENLAAFEGTSYDEWKGAAVDALHKFAAMRNFQIKFGPMPEGDNRYNFMAELDKVIEIDPVTARERKEADERAAAQALRDKQIADRLAAMQRAGQV